MRELHTRLYFSSILPLALTIMASISLSGCMSSGGYNSQPWVNKESPQQQTAAQTPNDLSVAAVEQYNLDTPSQGLTPEVNARSTIKVAILLPLSGKHSKLGNAMLNSAQMALFDLGFNDYELLPKDTKGTSAGARIAAKAAINDGAKLVLGPVFSNSVKAARQVTMGANVNMVAFSTDWTLANNKTFLIGFLPFNQVERVINHAARAGYIRVGVLSPKDNYGNSVISAYSSISQKAGIQTSRIAKFSPRGNDLNTVVRKFADYDARKSLGNAHGAPFDAVLMPMGGTLARQAGSFLDQYDLPSRDVKRLGTGLMDDKSLASDRTLNGAWFAAPDPQPRKKFERKYKNLFFAKPPRLASLSYDATALSIILAHMGQKSGNNNSFSNQSITNPNGFFGIDGIFRFRRDGIVERGLAVLEYRNGKIAVIDPAPKTFQQRGF